MMTGLLAFLGVSVLVICTPGPDTALTVRNSIVGGRRAGVLTAAGIATGQLVWTIAASFGIAGLLQASQPAFTALKIVGAAYLVFLGLQSILAAIRGRHGNACSAESEPPELAPRRAMRQGFISNLANPKMAAFFLSLLPQFVPGPSGSFAALVPLGLVFCLMTFGWLSLYAVVLISVGPFLQRSRVRRDARRGDWHCSGRSGCPTRDADRVSWLSSRRVRWRKPRKHHKDSLHELLELLHEVAQELLGRLVGDLTVLGDQTGRELDIGLRSVHLGRVAEAQDAAQVLLGDRGADLAGRRADHGGRLAGEGILAPWAACPVDGVLERAGNVAVVFGRHEQHRVDSRDRVLEGACFRAGNRCQGPGCRAAGP